MAGLSVHLGREVRGDCKIAAPRARGESTFTESNGDQSSIIFGCLDDNKTGASDCWGGLRGISGGTTGKTGTIVWHQVRSTDGKTGNVNGTGQWN